MGAAQVLDRLRAAGFELHCDGERLTVTPASRLSDADRAGIRAHKEALLKLLSSASAPATAPWTAANDPGAPYSTADGPDDARIARMARLGWPEARALATAERLRTRDTLDDDRRMCVECSHLGDSGRCIAAATGRLRGVDRRLEPVPDLLQRCEAFGLRKGMP